MKAGDGGKRNNAQRKPKTKNGEKKQKNRSQRGGRKERMNRGNELTWKGKERED